MSDLVENTEDRFSQNEAHIVEETGEPRENQLTWIGDNHPATCLHPGIEPRVATMGRECFISSYSEQPTTNMAHLKVLNDFQTFYCTF